MLRGGMFTTLRWVLGTLDGASTFAQWCNRVGTEGSGPGPFPVRTCVGISAFQLSVFMVELAVVVYRVAIA